MCESAGVKPLHEVFEVLGVVGWEGEGGGRGFKEVVVGVECCCEEGGDGEEGFEVEGEGGAVWADC